MAAVGNLKVYTIAGRTDSDGVAQDDLDQEEARLLVTMLTGEGIWPLSGVDKTPNRDAWKVRQNTGSDMKVKVGSGTSGADLLVLHGSVAGQGSYILRLDATTVTLDVPAADSSNPRRYGVYAFVNDAAYSGTSNRAYAGLEVLAGTPAPSPTVPGPDADWSASKLLWSFQLAANATAVTNTILDDSNASDERTFSSVLGVNPLDVIPFI